MSLPTGCYVDGAHGIFAPRQVCLIASAHGWSGNVPTDNDCRDDSDYAVDQAEEAEAWLNENVAEGDKAFGWFDGEFYYWTESEWTDAFE